LNINRLFEILTNTSVLNFLSLQDESKYLANLQLEEIKFKTTTELQKFLSQLLPPKEVFLSTTFLMQDSENIFEMSPSDRINVFKNIFGLV
jgi:hypothetical protein